jgi:hypothetical protein
MPTRDQGEHRSVHQRQRDGLHEHRAATLGDRRRVIGHVTGEICDSGVGRHAMPTVAMVRGGKGMPPGGHVGSVLAVDGRADQLVRCDEAPVLGPVVARSRVVAQPREVLLSVGADRHRRAEVEQSDVAEVGCAVAVDLVGGVVVGDRLPTICW